MIKIFANVSFLEGHSKDNYESFLLKLLIYKRLTFIVLSQMRRFSK